MLKICYLYPDLLNLQGNWGNMAALIRRSAWRNIEFEFIGVKLGEPIDFNDVDIAYLGSGFEQERQLVLQDLMPRKENLRQAIETGLVMLACGSGFRLMGMQRWNDGASSTLGLGLFDFSTRLSTAQLVGDCVFSMTGNSKKIVGFENHNELTYLGQGVEPLGRILYGHGNNGADQSEGFRYKNVIGSNVTALLPKNAFLADLLLAAALQNKRLPFDLQPLDDSLENRAVEVMLKRLLPSRKTQ